MFLALWNYLQGYVIIKVYGFSTERFINMASYRGIHIWDMNIEEGCVYIKVSLSDFKMLKECAKKTGCKFEIIKRCGFPFFVDRYRKRKILALGIPLFIVCIYILSSFLWKIDIYGNDRVSKTDILKMLDDNGISAGVLKFNIDTKETAKKIIEQFPDISWASVSINGTELIVKVSETIEKTTIEDNTPSDIISSKDGIIEGIAVSSGTPIVKIGDVVYEGDTLVSGEIILKDGEEEVGKEYTASKAQVFAKVWYEFYNEVPLVYNENIYTGDNKTDIYITLNGVMFNIITPKIEYKNYDTQLVYEKNFSLGDYILPFSIVKNTYNEYNIVKKQRTEEEAKLLTEYKIEEKIMEETVDCNIIDKETEYILKDNILYSKTIVTAIERIDKQVKRSDYGIGAN